MCPRGCRMNQGQGQGQGVSFSTFRSSLQYVNVLILTQTVTPIVNSDLLRVAVDSQLNSDVFMHVFVFFFLINVKNDLCFYSQIMFLTFTAILS